LIIRVVFGPAYAPGGIALSILMPAAFVSFINHTLGGTLVAVGLQKYSLYATILGAMVSVTSVLLLVPTFSLVGAAFSHIFAEAASVLVYIFVFRRFLNKYRGGESHA